MLQGFAEYLPSISLSPCLSSSLSLRIVSGGESPACRESDPEAGCRGPRALGEATRTRWWLARAGGTLSGETPGPAERHGSPGRAPEPTRGGQRSLAARRRPAHRLAAGPHRQNHSE